MGRGRVRAGGEDRERSRIKLRVQRERSSKLYLLNKRQSSGVSPAPNTQNIFK